MGALPCGGCLPSQRFHAQEAGNTATVTTRTVSRCGRMSPEEPHQARGSAPTVDTAPQDLPWEPSRAAQSPPRLRAPRRAGPGSSSPPGGFPGDRLASGPASWARDPCSHPANRQASASAGCVVHGRAQPQHRRHSRSPCLGRRGQQLDWGSSTSPSPGGLLNCPNGEGFAFFGLLRGWGCPAGQ